MQPFSNFILRFFCQTSALQSKLTAFKCCSLTNHQRIFWFGVWGDANKVRLFYFKESMKREKKTVAILLSVVPFHVHRKYYFFHLNWCSTRKKQSCFSYRCRIICLHATCFDAITWHITFRCVARNQQQIMSSNVLLLCIDILLLSDPWDW